MPDPTTPAPTGAPQPPRMWLITWSTIEQHSQVFTTGDLWPLLSDTLIRDVFGEDPARFDPTRLDADTLADLLAAFESDTTYTATLERQVEAIAPHTPTDDPDDAADVPPAGPSRPTTGH